MDEVLFRSSQKIENLQVKLNLVKSQGKEALQQYSEQGKTALIQVWNNPHTVQIKQRLNELWTLLISVGQNVKQQILLRFDLKQFYESLAKVFWRRWTKRDVYFLSAGFVFGGIFGIFFALSLRKKPAHLRYMQAVQCSRYLGIESAIMVENAVAPNECNENQVLITVKAASVQIIDAEICHGYGHTLRRILRKIYKQSHSDLPVILGRDCTGIIVDIGSNVKRLEIGDEVWLTVPFWSQGTMAQTILVAEQLVGKKPKSVGFEGACSLPYSGTLALDALKRAQLTSETTLDKRVLVLDGCTPIGCVLVQILKHWGATVAVTCSKRALPVAKALGASDAITCLEVPERNHHETSAINSPNTSTLLKELELRDLFDVVIVTKTHENFHLQQLQDYCKIRNILLVSTVPEKCGTDSFGLTMRFLLELALKFKYFFESMLGSDFNDFDEAHMCYGTLDEISQMVEDGFLQTVVDKVYQPNDIEMALNHIQSHNSIGSTIITFR